MPKHNPPLCFKDNSQLSSYHQIDVEHRWIFYCYDYDYDYDYDYYYGYDNYDYHYENYDDDDLDESMLVKNIYSYYCLNKKCTYFKVIEEQCLFKDSQLFKNLKNNVLIESTKLTSTRSLLCILPKRKLSKAKTFQYLFMYEAIWILLDWENETMRKISSIVYPIYRDELEVSLSFKISKRSNRNSQVIFPFDMNGGFSDGVLYHNRGRMMMMNNEIIDYSPSALNINNAYMHIIHSERPYINSNPDLFLIHFGGLRFWFKLVDEIRIGQNLFKNLRQAIFSDCLIITESNNHTSWQCQDDVY